MTRVRYVSAVKYTEPFERRRGLFKHDSEIWDWSYAVLGSHELLPPENSTQNARQPFAPTQEADWKKRAGDGSDEQVGFMADVRGMYRRPCR